MITTHYYLDSRHIEDDSLPGTLKLLLTRRGRTAMIPVGVQLLPSQWDKKAQRVTKHDQKNSLNLYLTKFKINVDEKIRELLLTGSVADCDITTIKNMIQESIDGRRCSTKFSEYFLQVIDSRRAEGTKRIYRNALRACRQFDIHCDGRSLTEISDRWASEFIAHLASPERKLAQNSRNSILSCVRGVLNCALRDELIRTNPFKDVKTPYVQTRRRNLTQAQIRQLWNATTRTKYEEAGLDFFKFSFLTIAMNAVDVSKLTPKSIFNDRIEYRRSKTGKQYSIAIVEELRPLLAKWSDDKMLFNFFDAKNEHNVAVPALNCGLRTLCKREKLPPVSTYWARHTWASLAMELSTPIEVISAALGHSYGARVTVGYINMSQKRVDEAHRRVIDFALYEPLKTEEDRTLPSGQSSGR